MRTALGARLGACLTTSALLLTTAVACTGDDGGSGGGGDRAEPATPQQVATSLAQALAGDDVGAVTFADPADTAAVVQPELLAALGDLADTPHTVAVSTVEQTDPPAGTDAPSSAAATLTWTWTLDPDDPTAGTWAYDVEVPLAQVGEEWRPEWSRSVVNGSLAEDEALEETSVEGTRGRVLGAGGAVLVAERPVQRIGIDKPQLATEQEVRASARALARLVGVGAKGYVAQVLAAGPQAFVAAIVYRQNQLPQAVENGLAAVPGARSIAGQEALAPTREFAAPILGRVGPVTAEMVEAEPDVYAAGDVAGLSGLQARYDEQLRGSPTLVVSAANDAGETRELTRTAAAPGTDLVLTLDEGLQRSAEQVLADVGPASALVAIRPSTGEVLAAANGPGNGGQNLATFGQYAPGSTFKIVSSLALLRAGLTPDSPVSCPATITVDGRRFGNYTDYPASGIGRIPLRTAVANSCNTAFIGQTDRVPPDALVAAANALGLGIDHEVGYPAYFGSVEPPTTQTGAAADLIGQGTVLASPLSMAAVVASVQRGATVIPQLVSQPAPTDTGAAPAAPLTAAEADTLRTLLRGVVTDGSANALAGLPGEPVIAKTGTAEFGTGPDLQTHAWMVAAQGDLAVAAFVDVGAGGSRTAGPLVEAFLRAAG